MLGFRFGVILLVMKNLTKKIRDKAYDKSWTLIEFQLKWWVSTKLEVYNLTRIQIDGYIRECLTR